MKNFDRIAATCPQCGHFGELEEARFTARAGEPTLFEMTCAECGHDWTCATPGAKASDALRNIMSKMYSEKEATTMQVEYNGFTGELVKLEQHKKKTNQFPCTEVCEYDLSIYDNEKHVTLSFTGVKMKDMKFLCGVVSFGV